MKLLRYGPAGREKPGLLDHDGAIRDLSGVIADLTPAEISPEGLKRLALIDPASLPVVAGPVRYGPPIKGSPKFLAIGLNYADHAKEANLPVPPEPIFFNKTTSCIQGPNDDIMIPRDARKLDWEVELGVVIGSRASYVEESEALDHIAGYVCINDISERYFQKELGSQWDKGKGCDTFGPIGPWLVTTDEVGDPQALDMFLEVNGVRMQTGNTRTMIFGVAAIVAYVSRFLTLEPGDLITTGTPPGVGEGQKPEAIWLKAGDRIHLGIEKLGQQSQTVIPFRHPRAG
jgi:2-keto-4-pentenoate hydratase/2-oxohepta-3-ene-1,7-dioic acid hydratase in catechol pathway